MSAHDGRDWDDDHDEDHDAELSARYAAHDATYTTDEPADAVGDYLDPVESDDADRPDEDYRSDDFAGLAAGNSGDDGAEGDGTDGGGEYDDDDDDAAPQSPLFTATNLQGTVTVATYANGRVERVELTPDGGLSNEADLAAEIRAVAHVAATKAGAAMHEMTVNILEAQGVDHATATQLTNERTPFNTQAEAEAAEAELAARDIQRG